MISTSLASVFIKAFIAKVFYGFAGCLPKLFSGAKLGRIHYDKERGGSDGEI